MEARVKHNRICLHLLQKSPFSHNLQALLWKRDVKPPVEPPERPARPHAGQGHGRFNPAKLRPSPAADLSLPPAHQMEPRTGLGRATGTATRTLPAPNPSGPLGRAPKSRCWFFRSHFLARPQLSRVAPAGSGSACGGAGGAAPVGAGAPLGPLWGRSGGGGPPVPALSAPLLQRIPLFRSLPPLRQRRWQQCDLAVPASLF